MFGPIPFIPPLTWSFKTYVKTDLCAAPIGGTSPCGCTEYYTTKSLSEYKQPWTTVSKEYIRERIYNAWKIIQLGIVIVLGWLIDPIWQTIWTLLFFLYPSADLVYAFNKENVIGDKTERAYSFCAAINLGSFVWFFIFLVWDFIIIFKSYKNPLVETEEIERGVPKEERLPSSYAKWLFKWIFKIQYSFLYLPISSLFSRITLTNALARARRMRMEGREIQRALVTELRMEIEQERRERERVLRSTRTTIMDTSRVAGLLRRNVRDEISPDGDAY